MKEKEVKRIINGMKQKEKKLETNVREKKEKTDYRESTTEREGEVEVDAYQQY